jgi:autotransporter-associated beta strand protein
MIGSVSLLACLASSVVLAKTSTWTGGGSNPSWNQAANWGGTAYANGDDAVFGNTARFENYMASGKTVKSITFTSDAPGYTIAPASNNSSTPTGYVLTFIPNNTGITVQAGNSSNHSIGVNSSGAQVGSISLNDDLPVTHNGNGILSLTRPVNGSFGIVKAGPGTLRLTSVNGYAGATTIDDGKVVAVVGASSSKSEVILNSSTATFSIDVTDNTQSWTCADLTTAAAGTLEFDFGAVSPSASVSPLVVTVGSSSGNGTADFTAATPAVSVLVDSGLLPGTYPLMTWDAISGIAPAAIDLTVSQLLAETVADLAVSDNTLNLVISSTAASIVKDDNAIDLNLGGSWVGGTAPGTDDLAKWDNTVNSANSSVLGTDLTWRGVVIEDPAGLVTIGAGNTLTLGAAALDLDMSAATADFILNCDLLLGDANIWNVAGGRELTLGGVISGASSITKEGDGTAVLSGPNTYEGSTNVSAGTVRLGVSEVIPDGAGKGNITVNGSLDMNGNSETINGLSGSGVIDNTAASTVSTLTVGQNGQSSTFDGILQNSGGVLNLTKIGAGTLTLGGTNTLGGSVTVENGKLSFSDTSPLENISGITMADGTRLGPVVGDVVINAPITVGVAGTNVTIEGHSQASSTGTTSIPFTLNGAISGDGNVTFAGIESTNDYGLIILNAASDYTGSTLITTSSGTDNANLFVRLGVANALPVTTVLTLDGGNGTGTTPRICELNLAGSNQTLAGIQNVSGLALRTQQIVNTSGTLSTLTINNADSFTYSARIGGGTSGNNVALTKSGPGLLTLSGTNTYTGATTLTGGTLELGASDVLADSTPVTIGAASLAITGGFSDTMDTLAVTGAATVDLGAGAALAFADSSGESWTGSLTITGDFVSGASLRFGTDASGLTSNQLASIAGPGLSGIGIDSNGFITATVESGGYSAWAVSNAGGQGADGDFDGDGVANGVEFFLNAAAGFTALPVLDGSNAVIWTNGGNIPASAYGTQFVVQTSDNLVNWSDVPVEELEANTDGPAGTLGYTLDGASPRFVRLKVMPE